MDINENKEPPLSLAKPRNQTGHYASSANLGPDNSDL